MITHPAIAKVRFMGLNGCENKENIIFQAKTWEEAMADIAKYYGSDLLSVEIVLLEDTPVVLSDETYADLAEFKDEIIL